jgi:hypothetical protein
MYELFEIVGDSMVQCNGTPGAFPISTLRFLAFAFAGTNDHWNSEPCGSMRDRLEATKVAGMMVL